DGLFGFRAIGFQRVSFDFENGVFGWDSGSNQTSHEAAPETPLPPVSCGEGFQDNNCQLAMEAIALLLKQLNAQIAGWRVVVVPAARWSTVLAAFGAARSAPAFSSLATRTTYVSEALLFSRAGTDTELRALTPLAGIP